MDKKIIAKPNEAAREDFLRQSGDELLRDGWYSGYILNVSSSRNSTDTGKNTIFEFSITGPIESDKKLYEVFPKYNPTAKFPTGALSLSVSLIYDYQLESIFQSLKLSERELLFTKYENIPLNFFVSNGDECRAPSRNRIVAYDTYDQMKLGPLGAHDDTIPFPNWVLEVPLGSVRNKSDTEKAKLAERLMAEADRIMDTEYEYCRKERERAEAEVAEEKARAEAQRIRDEKWEAGREERERLAAEKQRIEDEEWEAGREERERRAREEDKERHDKAMKNLGLEPISAKALKDQHVLKRPKMFGGTLERRVVTVLSGAGGVGKSLFALSMALAMTSGRDLTGFVGGGSVDRRKVLMISNEDSKEELILRSRGICKGAGLSGEEEQEAFDELLLVSGSKKKLILARKAKNGAMEPTEVVGLIEAMCDRNYIRAIVIDPLVSIHTGDENSNVDMEQVMGILRGLAERTGAAVLVLHHIRKSSGSSPNVDDSTRGASAVVNAARHTMLLTSLSSKDASRYGIAELERGLYFGVTSGKNNYGIKDGTTTFFKNKSIDVPVISLAAQDNEYAASDPCGYPVMVDLESGSGDKPSTIMPVHVVRVLQQADASWPAILSDYFEAFSEEWGVAKSGVYDRVKCLPSAKEMKAEVKIQGVLYGVWTEKIDGKKALLREIIS
ncbi:AAA family ATPase [Halioglobus sp. Uisw_031]|uniref:AAA family ATPase n=1 Tax=Halioglobus sp. Uisw_031 TaxID=3230977 RepID=UPI0039EA766C